MWATATLPEQATCDRGAWLRATVASAFPHLADLTSDDVVHLKGFGSRMDHDRVMDATRAPLAAKRVVVVDGDWYKRDSFVAAAEHVLARPDGVLVLFRKETPPTHTVWGTYDPLLKGRSTRALHVVVPPEVEAKELAHVACVPGVTNAAYTALGCLTMRVCDASLVLAVGGGETTVNEYRVCEHVGTAARWTRLDVPRAVTAPA